MSDKEDLRVTVYDWMLRISEIKNNTKLLITYAAIYSFTQYNGGFLCKSNNRNVIEKTLGIASGDIIPIIAELQIYGLVYAKVMENDAVLFTARKPLSVRGGE